MNKTNLLCGPALLLVWLTACAGSARADYAQEVRQDKPLAWWRFDDLASSSGAIARDQMGVHPGAYHGGVALEAEGPPTGGKAATFDGKSYVEIPHAAGLALNTLSVEFWFKSTQAWDQPYWPGSAALVSKATPGVGSGDWTIICRLDHRGPKSGPDYCRQRAARCQSRSVAGVAGTPERWPMASGGLDAVGQRRLRPLPRWPVRRRRQRRRSHHHQHPAHPTRGRGGVGRREVSEGQPG